MRMSIASLAVFLLALTVADRASAQPVSSHDHAVPVTVDNFTRAETDRYFGGSVQQAGLGTFHHFREPTPIEKQNVIAQFIAICRRSKWSKHFTNSPRLA